LKFPSLRLSISDFRFPSGMTRPILIVPGLFDSGPGHWQSLFEKKLADARRVVQADWAHPDRALWVETLRIAVGSCAEPPVLVAHSLGCITAAHLAASGDPGAVAAALLVAPTDVERDDAPGDIRSFRPIPMRPLLFQTVLVASSDDPYLSVERSRELALAWGSHWFDAGPAGHINAASGFGEWPDGERLLRELTG
jgi:predicted alpha/beta hydrolase family esterase